MERRHGLAGALPAVRDHLAVVRRAAPLAAWLLTALVTQAGLAGHLAVRSVEPDVLLLAVVAVAAGRGVRAGAAFGFAAGLGADVFLTTPLGTSALAYTLVGHVVGRSGRPRPPVSASALCSPTSTCFSCRTGRRHVSAGVGEVRSAAAGAGDAPPARPGLRRRRSAAHRTALRRSMTLAFLAVATGRVGTAMVATALGGLPFPASAGLLHIVGVASLSAPLGIPAAAAGRRPGLARGGRR